MNDIALIKLRNAVQLTSNIQIACLPNPRWPLNYPIPGQPAWIVGWGVTEEESDLPSEMLRNVRIKIYDGSACNSVLTNKQKDWNSQICAGDFEIFFSCN